MPTRHNDSIPPLTGPAMSLVAPLLLSLGLSGCIDPAQRAQMAESDSILAPLMSQPGVRDAALWASDQYDADKRARGTVLLANAPFGGADAYLSMYREYLTDPAPGVRAAAARGLGMHGSPEDVPRIVPLLADEQRSVRLDAVKALQRLHNPAAINPLIERTKVEVETDGDIRAGAATALGQYAEPRVVQALIAALDDDQFLVTRAAHESLQTLTGNLELPDDRKLWQQWVASKPEPFANRQPYFYPVFQRDAIWTDYLPFIGGPAPNEAAAQPAGMPSVAGTGSGDQ